jgi:Mg2+/Co2+ transporter CorB
MPELIDASTPLRELNRRYGLHLPTDGPKTLNGLILELLEQVPVIGTQVVVDGYAFEIVKVEQTMIQQVRLHTLVDVSQNQLNQDD